jgi:PAS domain S-box-containing protein
LRGRELARAIDRVNCGVCARNPDDTIAYANERLQRWLGYEPNALVGRPLASLVPEEVRDEIAVEMKALEQGDERARLTALLRRDGTSFPVIVLPHAIRGEDGRYQGSIVLFVDLGTVQTAKPVGAAAGREFPSTLARIAQELQSMSLHATLPVPRIPLRHPELAELSPRESEVLAQLMGGYRVPSIAQRLHISQHTVRNHLKSIYRKAGVQSQADLIQWVHSLSG